MEAAGYFAILLMGGVLGLVGAGGGILTVPILVYLFHVPPVVATSYSLCVVGVSSLIGCSLRWQQRDVDFKVAVIFGMPALAGVLGARALLLPNVPEQLWTMGPLVVTKSIALMAMFAVLMLWAAISMLRPRRYATTPVQPSWSPIRMALQAWIIGTLTGLVGASGGFLIIPALSLQGRLPLKIAMGTSLMIMGMNSSLGFLGDILLGQQVSLPFLLGLVSLAILGILVGAQYRAKISEQRLRFAFALLVLLMGSGILLEQIRQM